VPRTTNHNTELFGRSKAGKVLLVNGGTTGIDAAATRSSIATTATEGVAPPSPSATTVTATGTTAGPITTTARLFDEAHVHVDEGFLLTLPLALGLFLLSLEISLVFFKPLEFLGLSPLFIRLTALVWLPSLLDA
jgi:hypothetical protein